MIEIGRPRTTRLYGLWLEQRGRCVYCDGPTFVVEREHKDDARRRLRIEAGVSGAGKNLTQHVATLDSETKQMSCKFCNCSRAGLSAAAHRRAMQALVAADRHPVNRLVETYEFGRLSWSSLEDARRDQLHDATIRRSTAATISPR
ncbi:hypothetical protein E0H22_15430 [Rhodopseudomonas boonkerdii]|uniref:hypothetical protein n=1 Tax=Rhodopseudomonas boonkerdii TaxID=475937 RepID=UPI001E31AD3B|nr:hypothetical protein [Rhodopseudomonas boonkerdii]UGV26955.1 hypothetical protein E0H22_15430 [Rhodopseudomonas boonkerdii]